MGAAVSMLAYPCLWLRDNYKAADGSTAVLEAEDVIRIRPPLVGRSGAYNHPVYCTPIWRFSIEPYAPRRGDVYSNSVRRFRRSPRNARTRSLSWAALVRCSGVSTPRTSKAIL